MLINYMNNKISNINFFLPEETKKAFKLAVINNGQVMSKILIDFINKYVAKNTITDR